MQKRYLVLAAIGGSAVWATAGQISPAKAPVEFTKAALPPPASVDLRAAPSSSHIVMPVELGALAQRAEQALPENLALVRDWLPDAACGKRVTNYDCVNAKLEGTITRSGHVALQIAPAMIKLNVPVKYALSATGNGWASYLTERKVGETSVEIAFAISVNPAGGLDVTRRDVAPADEAPIGLLKANVRLSKLLESQLRPIARTAEDDLRRALAVLPVKTAVAHAWDALAQPLELGQGSGLWLKGAPDFYTAGAFVSVDGKLTYQIPIATHMAIVEADKGQSNNAKRVANLSQDVAPVGPSRVRVAVPVDLEAMRQQAEAAFGNGQVFESRADRFSEPVKVKVRSTRVYPALRQIGLELEVEVTTSKGATFSGKLNLAGRPVLDAAAGTVTLADVSFPPVSAKDAGGQMPGVPRLGTEPFATKFASVAKLDVARALAEVLPRAKQMLNQQVGSDLALQSRLTDAVPVALELARDGAWLMVDLTGDVAFVYNGAMDTTNIPALTPIATTAAAGAAGGAAAAAATLTRPGATAAAAAVKSAPESKKQTEHKSGSHKSASPRSNPTHTAKADAVVARAKPSPTAQAFGQN